MFTPNSHQQFSFPSFEFDQFTSPEPFPPENGVKAPHQMNGHQSVQDCYGYFPNPQQFQQQDERADPADYMVSPTMQHNNAYSPSNDTEPSPNVSKGVKKKSFAQYANSSSSLLASDKSELCRVCSEAATKHMHYGAITCFSCKAFFRRAIQNEVWHEFICRSGGSCDINLRSRKHCQKCRYERCLAVGMKPGWVLSKVERQNRFRRRQRSPGNSGAPEMLDSSGLPITSTTSKTSSVNENDLPSKTGVIEKEPVHCPDPNEVNNPSADLHPEQEVSNDNDSSNAEAASPSMIENEIKELRIFSINELNEENSAFVNSITKLVTTYDRNYHSIPLGEVIIKEMIMSSLFGIPISTSSSLAAYRLMIERVTRVALGFDSFTVLPKNLQATLLTHNADLVVCLQGSLFFNEKMEGLEQIKHSMGQEDLEKGLEMIKRIQNTQGFVQRKPRKMNPIQYTNFNSIQKLDNPEMEHKFGSLLSRIGFIAGKDSAILKLFTFILLFSTDSLELKKEDKDVIEAKQAELISILQRLIKIKFNFPNAIQFLSKLLGCISDLRELNLINLRRSFTEEAIKVSENTDETQS